MPKNLLKDIFFVGYVDWIIRDFHSFETRRGVTYNSYLILDEKIALIDCVKAPFYRDLYKNIEEVALPEKIEYIVINHAEPDHAGALSELLKVCKKAKVVCSQKCKEILSGYNDISTWNFHLVKSGDTILLGKKSLEFIETPMVHWPDSMFTYLREEKALFSMDAFGQHFSSSSKFDDEVDFCEVMQEAKKYYANILAPYGKQVLITIDKLSKYDIEVILPAHGVIWKKYIDEIINSYRTFANFIPSSKVLVIYDTMWQSTKLMAEAIYRGAAAKDVEAKLIDARATGLADIANEVLDAASIAFGSATLNMTMMPAISAILTYLKGLAPKNKNAALFGSFGWGKGAVEDMALLLDGTDFKMVSTPLKVKWRPTDSMLDECFNLGGLLADKAREISNIKNK